MTQPEPSRLCRARLLAAVLSAALAGVGCAPMQARPPAADVSSASPPPVPPAAVSISPMPAASPPPLPPTIVYVPRVEPVDLAARHVLAYHALLARLGPADLAHELARIGDGSASPQAAVDRALVLAHTRTAGDLGRALALLERVLAEATPQAEPWHGIARLLAARLSEQRRAEEQGERLGQQIRDSQRDHQRKLDQLSEKIEALRAIERSLTSRPPPLPPPQLPAPPSSAPAGKAP